VIAIVPRARWLRSLVIAIMPRARWLRSLVIANMPRARWLRSLVIANMLRARWLRSLVTAMTATVATVVPDRLWGQRLLLDPLGSMRVSDSCMVQSLDLLCHGLLQPLLPLGLLSAYAYDSR